MTIIHSIFDPIIEQEFRDSHTVGMNILIDYIILQQQQYNTIVTCDICMNDMTDDDFSTHIIQCVQKNISLEELLNKVSKSTINDMLDILLEELTFGLDEDLLDTLLVFNKKYWLKIIQWASYRGYSQLLNYILLNTFDKKKIKTIIQCMLARPYSDWIDWIPSHCIDYFDYILIKNYSIHLYTSYYPINKANINYNRLIYHKNICQRFISKEQCNDKKYYNIIQYLYKPLKKYANEISNITKIEECIILYSFNYF